MIITNKLTQLQINEIKQLQQLCNIERTLCFDNSFFIDPNLSCFYLNYEDEILVSFLTLFYVDPKEMEVAGFTHPSYRGKGYGTKMLKRGQNKNLWEGLK